MALSEYQQRTLTQSGLVLDGQPPSVVRRLQGDTPSRPTGIRVAPVSDWLRRTHLVSVVGLTSFVAAVVVLHGLRGDLNPAEHTISEYSLGRYGWLMRTAFAALGLGVLATAASLRLRFDGSSWWRAALVLLACTAVGLFLDAGYNTDHPRVSETALGRVHGIGMLIVCLSLPAASFLLGLALTSEPQAVAKATWLLVLGAAQVIAILGFEISPTDWRGLTERVAIATALITLAVLQSLARFPAVERSDQHGLWTSN